MRLRLPDTRSSVTRKCSVGSWELYVTVGFYDNRQPGELFVKIAKHGSTTSGLMDGVAVMASMLLQYGVPWNSIAAKFKNTAFQPAGADEQHQGRVYSSLLDCLAMNVGEIVRDGDGNPEFGYNGPPKPEGGGGTGGKHSFPPPGGPVGPTPMPVGGGGSPPAPSPLMAKAEVPTPSDPPRTVAPALDSCGYPKKLDVVA